MGIQELPPPHGITLETIVVYQGAITKYGIIRYLIQEELEEGELRKANKEEQNRWHKRPVK